MTIVSGIKDLGDGVKWVCPQGWVTFRGGDLLQEVGRVLPHRALEPQASEEGYGLIHRAVEAHLPALYAFEVRTCNASLDHDNRCHVQKVWWQSQPAIEHDATCVVVMDVGNDAGLVETTVLNYIWVSGSHRLSRRDLRN